jgi:hypothetical protein
MWSIVLTPYSIGHIGRSYPPHPVSAVLTVAALGAATRVVSSVRRDQPLTPPSGRDDRQPRSLPRAARAARHAGSFRS